MEAVTCLHDLCTAPQDFADERLRQMWSNHKRDSKSQAPKHVRGAVQADGLGRAAARHLTKAEIEVEKANVGFVDNYSSTVANTLQLKQAQKSQDEAPNSGPKAKKASKTSTTTKTPTTTKLKTATKAKTTTKAKTAKRGEAAGSQEIPAGEETANDGRESMSSVLPAQHSGDHESTSPASNMQGVQQSSLPVGSHDTRVDTLAGELAAIEMFNRGGAGDGNGNGVEYDSGDGGVRHRGYEGGDGDEDGYAPPTAGKRKRAF
jgi:hypothetical protein